MTRQVAQTPVYSECCNFSVRVVELRKPGAMVLGSGALVIGRQSGWRGMGSRVCWWRGYMEGIM